MLFKEAGELVSLTLKAKALAAMTGVLLCWEEANQTGFLTPAAGHCLSNQPFL